MLRIRNAAQLVRVCKNGEKFKRGKDMDQVEIIENGTIVIGRDGLIEAVGPESELGARYADHKFDTDIDATGKSVVPGLVDAHTHPVWSGDRTHEFAMKLSGATYMDIHKAGGGIGFTVRNVKQSSVEQLKDLLVSRLNRMMKNGTTLVEAKSGYGQDCENEMKMLKVLEMAKKTHPIEIVSTYLGAHSVPKDKTAQEFTDEIVNVHLPELKRLIESGEISCDFVDVFHEKGIFEYEETRRILQAAKDLGLRLNFHGDELHYVKSAELSGQLRASAVSHLENISDEGIKAMCENDVCATLLPTTAYVLRIEEPPARKMIDNGVIVAIASDFNPNAHCMSMPFVMNLSCVKMRLTMNEALVAATINAAASLDRSATHGSLEVGKAGDCVVVDAPLWQHLIYEMVDPPISHVVKRGKVVFQS